MSLLIIGVNTKAFLIAAIAGVLLLSFNMVRLETAASDSDFDILFGLRMIIFDAASLLIYAVVFLIAKVVVRLAHGKTTREDQ